MWTLVCTERSVGAVTDGLTESFTWLQTHWITQQDWAPFHSVNSEKSVQIQIQHFLMKIFRLLYWLNRNKTDPNFVTNQLVYRPVTWVPECLTDWQLPWATNQRCLKFTKIIIEENVNKKNVTFISDYIPQNTLNQLRVCSTISESLILTVGKKKT